MKCLFVSISALCLISGLSFAQDGGASPGGGFAFKSCPSSPNCVSSQAVDPEHAIAPIAYAESRSEALARLKRVLASMKRTAIVSERADYLHAEAKSLIFRFVDDVEFYLPDNQKVIHVRSASRVGYSDLGVNRKRVEEIRKRFNEMK